MNFVRFLESSELFKPYKVLVEYINEHSLDMQVEIEDGKILIYDQGVVSFSLNSQEASHLIEILSTPASAYKYATKHFRFKLGEPMIKTDSDVTTLYIDYLFRLKGVKLQEKPSYWEDLLTPISTKALTEVFTILKEAEISMEVIPSKELYGISSRVSGPLASWKTGGLPAETPMIYIIDFKDQGMYLCDRMGANSYCRNWGLIPADFNPKTFLS